VGAREEEGGGNEEEKMKEKNNNLKTLKPRYFIPGLKEKIIIKLKVTIGGVEKLFLDMILVASVLRHVSLQNIHTGSK
jgi:hypothetical protein